MEARGQNGQRKSYCTFMSWGIGLPTKNGPVTVWIYHKCIRRPLVGHQAEKHIDRNFHLPNDVK